jgi:hypothetical protein
MGDLKEFGMGARFDSPFSCSLSEARFSCPQTLQQTFTSLSVTDSTNKTATQDKTNRISSTAYRLAAGPRTHL